MDGIRRIRRVPQPTGAESVSSRRAAPAWNPRRNWPWPASMWRGAERDDRKLLAPAVGGNAKRCLDLLLSLLLLPVAAILILPIALLIVLDGGKPLYAHLRVGRNGRLFRCYKLRTMIAEADAELEKVLREDEGVRRAWLEHYKLENDPRVTQLGWYLRKTNLDEVPQIWNVLKGEMSWVGPRPVIPDELSKYGDHLALYLACRPGITGLWQVERDSDTPYSKRVVFDAEYARNWSFGRDLGILLVTIPRIVAANSRPFARQPTA